MTTSETNTLNEANQQKNIYYVYFHRDPNPLEVEQEVVYIGKGIYGRAWDVTRCARYNHEHTKWLKQLSLEGYLPPDWVFIFRRNLSEKEAFDFEREMINHYSPRFNMAIRGSKNHWAKLNEEQVSQIKLRLAQKEPHYIIASDFGIQRTTVSMINTGRNWKHVL